MQIDPYKRLAEMAERAASISSQRLHFLEMLIAAELVVDGPLNDMGRTFVRKALGLKKEEFAVLCPNDDAIRSVISLRMAG